ncbi:matrixin family metalloprotease [Rhizobium johnstonii]|uniref:matrixin family metalloprotease n=1 Tax=Rhizobium TaxID=379 RepID=UPI001C9764B0|nr:matrixin family metalloprotease [Rhizobium leguminosarum]MBY5775954.1 matrixin family metalloprotease [Rhizobium leguminosarum]
MRFVKAVLYVVSALFLVCWGLPVVAEQLPVCRVPSNPIEFSFENRPLWRGDLRTATDTVPAVVEVTAERTVIFRATRWSQNFAAPVTAVISVQVEDGYQVLCTLKRQVLGGERSIAALVVDMPRGETKTLKIEIFDHGSGGPTGDPPYTVGAEIDHRPPPEGSLVQAIVKPIVEAAPAGGCDFVDGPTRPQATMEVIRKERLSSLSEGTVFIGYEMAGRNLYFRLGGPRPFDHFVEVRFLSKSSGEQPFKEVCSIDLSSWPSAGEYALASLKDDRIFNPIWRVEIVVQPGAATTDELEFSILRDLDPGRPGVALSQEPYGSDSFLSSFVCQSLGGRGSIATQAAIPFAISSVLRIRTIDSHGLIPENNRVVLRNNLLEAVALWRRSCSLCLPGHMLFVEIDGELFTIGRDGSFAGYALFENEPVRQTRPRLGDPVLPTLPSDRSGTRTPTVGYVSVTRSSELVSRICSMSSQGPSTEASKVKAELCEPTGSGTPNSPEIELVVMDGPTSCGDQINHVACEPDGKRVEFNARDYRFRSWKTGDVLFGRGARVADLMPVLIHEVGHWIGVPHSAAHESIMAGSLEHARCIDNSTRDDLRRLAQGDVTPVKGPNKFTYFDSN